TGLRAGARQGFGRAARHLREQPPHCARRSGGGGRSLRRAPHRGAGGRRLECATRRRMSTRNARYAGILAALAIALTATAAFADEPAPSPASSAIPWLAQPAGAPAFTAGDGRPHGARALRLVLPALALGGG